MKHYLLLICLLFFSNNVFADHFCSGGSPFQIAINSALTQARVTYNGGQLRGGDLGCYSTGQNGPLQNFAICQSTGHPDTGYRARFYYLNYEGDVAVEIYSYWLGELNWLATVRCP